jgi:hypothetical protein
MAISMFLFSCFSEFVFGVLRHLKKLTLYLKSEKKEIYIARLRRATARVGAGGFLSCS